MARKKAGRKPAAKKKTAGRRVPKRPATPNGGGGIGTLDAATTEELQRELVRRQREVQRLERQRRTLQDKLAEVDSLLAAARGSIVPSGRRPRNDSNLADALYEQIRGREMSVGEAADAVIAAGYRTTSKTFRVIVNQTLIRDPRFSKVGRGVYTAK